jgi:hypothetical protein
MRDNNKETSAVMPRIADFVVIQDHGVTLPRPAGGVQFRDDFTFPAFDAPGAAGAPSVLSLRLKVENGTPVFRVTFNDTDLFEGVVESGPERSWHETITQTPVKSTANRLRVEIDERDAASLTVSDVVLLYQAQIP